MIQPKESWTHDFCLLSDTEQDKTPSQEALALLKEAELGKKKVVFPNKKGDFQHFKDVLEKEYDKLKSQDEAFELMRAETGGISRPLKLISIPSNGYTIPYIKDVVGNSTLIYIRPMKSCLSLDKSPQPVTLQSPLTKCPNCFLSIPIMQLRNHSQICNDSDISDESLEYSVFDDNKLPSVGSAAKLKSDEMATSTKSTVIKIDDEQPSSSSGRSFIDEGIASLTPVFPDEGIETVRNALMTYEDVELAACALLNTADDENESTEKVTEDKDVYDTLKRLRNGMKSFISAERVKVDEEDVAIDLLQYYKSSEFDPKIQLVIRFRSQPGVDSGGLLRQAFTSAFEAIAQNQVPRLKLFTGPPNRLTPMYSTGNLLSSIFETLGKMIGHSLIQQGPGFPYLAPAIYCYIATGDLNEAISRASRVDVMDAELLMILEKVNDH